MPKSLWRLYSKNSLKRNLCQTNSSRNLYQKSIGKNISTTNSLRRNLYKTVFKRNPNQNIFDEQIYPKKSTNKYLKIRFDPSMSEEKFATKQSVKGNCLPNKLRMEISSKQIPKETSTKEYLEKHVYQKKTKESWMFFRLHLPKPFRQKTFETSLCWKNPDRKLSKPKIL